MLNERVIESALAYFLAPLVAVAVGVLFFARRSARRRSSRSRSRSSALSCRASRWARRRGWRWRCARRGRLTPSSASARRCRPPSGLLIESAGACAACAGAAVVGWQADAAWLHHRTGPRAILLAIAGPVTALPLMAFAFGARRVSFTTLGPAAIRGAVAAIRHRHPLRRAVHGLARGVSFALIWAGLALSRLGHAASRKRRA